MASMLWEVFLAAALVFGVTSIVGSIAALWVLWDLRHKDE